VLGGCSSHCLYSEKSGFVWYFQVSFLARLVVFVNFGRIIARSSVAGRHAAGGRRQEARTSGKCVLGVDSASIALYGF